LVGIQCINLSEQRCINFNEPYSDNSIVDDDSPTVEEFENSITQWAANQKSDGPLYVYLIDHGGVDTYNLFPGEIIHAQKLNEWLTVFQDATHRDVIIMIEACKSGTFIDNLDTNAQKRIVITSTNHQDAYLDPKGTLSFTQFFMDRVRTVDSIQKSYLYACKKLENIGQPYNLMNPQLVDDELLNSDTMFYISFCEIIKSCIKYLIFCQHIYTTYRAPNIKKQSITDNY